MEWFIIFAICCLTGAMRFLDGSNLSYPRFVTTAGNAIATGLVAWIASTSLTVSVIVGICSAATVQAGYTSWANLLWQLLRGFLPCALMLLLLIWLGHSLPLQSALSMLGLHMLAFGQYYGVDKVKMPIGHYEQWARVIQGFAICTAAALV